MANTYRKFYIQLVFAVKNREALLDKSWRLELFQYIAGIINKRNHYSLAVNGVEDHLHIFLDYNGIELIEDLVREVKKATNIYINRKKLTRCKFEWQSGYGVFSYSYREKDMIINYIKRQEEHHKKKSFKEEYLQFMEAYEINYKQEYIFNFLDLN